MQFTSVLFGDRRVCMGAVAAALLVSLRCVAAEELPGAGEAPPPEIEAGGVVIQATPPSPQPTIDELMQRFRESLATERLLTPVERPLAGGLVEVKTRYGRVCLPSVTTPFTWSDLTGNFALASRCLYY